VTINTKQTNKFEKVLWSCQNNYGKEPEENKKFVCFFVIFFMNTHWNGNNNNNGNTVQVMLN